MRGSKLDVLGFTIQRADQRDQPCNKYVVSNNLLGFVDVELSLNTKEVLASRRNAPLKVSNRPQGPVVGLQSTDIQVFNPGGIAFIPNAGIWQRVS